MIRASASFHTRSRLRGSSEDTSILITPLARYRQDLVENRITEDPVQLATMAELDRVFHALLARRGQRPGLWRRLMQVAFRRQAEPVSGLYLWGGVGRGKTYMMDIFYQCLPGERKTRMHFHRFMQSIHRGLNDHIGEVNPLQQVAQDIAGGVDVICFDEFFVSDIGDAMILANLLETLFRQGVCLVATSNIDPARLYENGLQRQKFLPAIALIQRHTRVVNVDGEVDYRLRSLEQAEIYHSPLDEGAQRMMEACFGRLTSGLEHESRKALEILGRNIPVRRWAEGVAWFDFSALCDGPRSAADYIELARLCHSVLLSNVPAMDGSRDNQARRFISLVDEFYDHRVKLIISAEVPMVQLYGGEELAFPFQRTLSRLLEMQSHDYLAREHCP